PDAVLSTLDQELDKLAGAGPEPTELARVTARWTAELYADHDRIVSRTLALGGAELLHGRAELIGELPTRIAAVTAADVATAAKALRPDSRAVLLIKPAGGAE